MRRTSHQEGDLRILLVEDNPFDSELIEAALQVRLGCHITTVATQSEFEAELERNSPDFILSDSNLPSFDGMKALALATKKCPKVPFIFCSGNISPERQAAALAHGATECVSKNNLESLVVLIERLSRETTKHDE
jgi:CheY-like chemotaxis protein